MRITLHKQTLANLMQLLWVCWAASVSVWACHRQQPQPAGLQQRRHGGVTGQNDLGFTAHCCIHGGGAPLLMHRHHIDASQRIELRHSQMARRARASSRRVEPVRGRVHQCQQLLHVLRRHSRVYRQRICAFGY